MNRVAFIELELCRQTDTNSTRQSKHYNSFHCNSHIYDTDYCFKVLISCLEDPSSPYGASINDGVDKEMSSLLYTLVDCFLSGLH